MKMFDAGKTRMIGLPYGKKNCDDICDYSIVSTKFCCELVLLIYCSLVYMFKFAFQVYFRQYLLLWCKSLPLKNFPVAWCLTYCLGNFRGVQVDVSRSFGDYILIDHAVDRSLCRKSVRERKFGVVSPVRCGELGW